MVKIRADDLSLEEPSLPKKQKVSNRANFLHGCKESASRHNENDHDFYFTAIDDVTETIKNRFNQPNYQMYIHIQQTLLTHFSPVSHFYLPRILQKTKGFLTFSGGIEMGHWIKMG